MEVTVKFGPEFFNKALETVKNWEAGNGWYEANPIGDCGYAPVIAGAVGGGSWTTSGGNSMTLLLGGGDVMLMYTGRRHGLSGMLQVEKWMKEGVVIKYDTTAPNLKWWETETEAARYRRTGIRRNPNTGVNERLEVFYDHRQGRYNSKWVSV